MTKMNRNGGMGHFSNAASLSNDLERSPYTSTRPEVLKNDLLAYLYGGGHWLVLSDPLSRLHILSRERLRS